MSQNIKGKSNKKKGAAELFIRVAKAYKESDFYSLYTELRESFPEVAKYLEDNTSPGRWSRAKQTGNRYSIMTTNGVESINGRLREERELPMHCKESHQPGEVNIVKKRIPCSHAIAAAYNANISVYEFCTDYYTTRYWLEAYTDPFYPVPGEWTVQEEILVLPPLVIPRRGRKKVKRIPSVGEYARRR
ncbi:uncharacterized protein [Henckelia pumila]|uniref:uncharacterized protein n=1 Tax=Henckelia pumila TaxID=405737 RepID=UPI003C6E5832